MFGVYAQLTAGGPCIEYHALSILLCATPTPAAAAAAPAAAVLGVLQLP